MNSPPALIQREGRNFFQLAFLGRMIFSCLVDADYLDTEAFMTGRKGDRPCAITPTLIWPTCVSSSIST